MASLPDARQVSDRVPPREVAAYATGVAMGNLTESVFTYLANPVFNVLLGVSPALVGAILATGRLWDAFSDTLMATITDNHRSRWGRRRPFILMGGILTGVTFASIYWLPPGWDPQGYFWYLVVAAFGFYTMHTVMMVPHVSLLPELSPAPGERTRLAAWASWLQFASASLMLWVLPMAQSSFFGDTMRGLRAVTGCIGLLVVGCAIGIFLNVRERHQERIQRQPRIPFFASLKATANVRPLYWLAGAQLFAAVAGSIGSSLGFYVMTFYMQAGDLKSSMIYQGWIGTSWIISTLVTVPLAVSLAKRIGRKNTYIMALSALAFGSAIRWFCYIPGHPIWTLLPVVFVGPGVAIVQMLTQAMIGDVVDWDELRTGARREGMIAAVQMWTMKTANSFNYALAGGIVTLIGFKADQGGHQSETTFLLLRLVFCFQPVLFLAVATWAILRYPLSEERVHEIRLELEQRRGA